MRRRDSPSVWHEPALLHRRIRALWRLLIASILVRRSIHIWATSRRHHMLWRRNIRIYLFWVLRGRFRMFSRNLLLGSMLLWLNRLLLLSVWQLALFLILLALVLLTISALFIALRIPRKWLGSHLLLRRLLLPLLNLTLNGRLLLLKGFVALSYLLLCSLLLW